MRDEVDQKPNIILVLGMHRSGTSLIAQLISKLGVNIGDKLVPANEFNPDGFWEYKPLVDFHDKLLGENANTWYAPINTIDTEQLLEKYEDEARSLVKQMDQSGKDWCWKDPRMPFFLDFWNQILSERQVNCLVVYRHPFNVVSSLKRRDNFPVSVSMALWELTSLYIFNFLLKKKSFIIIGYEKIINNTKEECERLLQFLNDTVYISRKKNLTDDILKLVKPSLNHHRLGTHFQINAFQQRMISGYQCGKPFNMFKEMAPYKDKLQHILYLYTLIPADEHIAQLYYSDESDSFSENYSIKRLVDDEKEIAFKLPDAYIPGRIRLDPLNDYVQVQVKAIGFYFHGKRVELFYRLSSNAISVENQVFLFSTNDPQIICEIQNTDKKEVDEIKIEMEYLKIGSQVIPLLCESYKRQIEIHCRNYESNLNQLKQEFSQKTNQEVAKEKGLDGQLESRKNKITELNEYVRRLNYVVSAIYSSTLFRLFGLVSHKSFVSIWNKLTGKLRKRAELRNNIRLIRKSGYFDSEFYLKNNPDVKKLNLPPLKHYLLSGGFEGRNPSPFFDSKFYLDNNPDVKAAKVNPLIHFVRAGKAEGRSPKKVRN